MKSKLIILYSWLIRTTMFFLPDIPIIMRIRGFLYGIGMIKCGKNFQITHNTIIKSLQNISIGDNVYIANNSIVMGSGKIIIEDEVLIGPSVMIMSGNHSKIKNSFRFGPVIPGQIILKKGTWVTSNCTLSRGAVLPEGSVLSANSFLNKEFQVENSLYGGVPAKLLKENI